MQADEDVAPPNPLSLHRAVFNNADDFETAAIRMTIQADIVRRKGNQRQSDRRADLFAQRVSFSGRGWMMDGRCISTVDGRYNLQLLLLLRGNERCQLSHLLVYQFHPSTNADDLGMIHSDVLQQLGLLTLKVKVESPQGQECTLSLSLRCTNFQLREHGLS